MSSLWTPGGEVPMERRPPAGEAQNAPPAGQAGAGQPPSAEEAMTADEAAMRAQIEELRRHMLAAPASDIVIEHLAGFYELAVLHLSQPEPRFPEARLAIDAIAAVVDNVGDRLGEAKPQLDAMVNQLRMAFVERQNQTSEPDA